LHFEFIVCILTILLHTINNRAGNMEKITLETIHNIFEDSSTYTADYLKKHFGCSYQYLWLNLKKVGYYSSFTHNSKYYTLVDIPEFNDNGIWFHTDPVAGEIGFTKYKTAANLIISLINSSETGMTEDKLREIMRIRLANQLNVLINKSKIQRLKLEQKYYYFSKDHNKYNDQYSQLTQRLALDIAWRSCSIAEQKSLSEQHYQHQIKRLTTSRANWHHRSNEKQKKLRAQLIRIRDLATSRDNWKRKAMDYKGEALQLKDELKTIKKNSSMPII